MKLFPICFAACLAAAGCSASSGGSTSGGSTNGSSSTGSTSSSASSGSSASSTTSSGGTSGSSGSSGGSSGSTGGGSDAGYCAVGMPPDERVDGITTPQIAISGLDDGGLLLGFGDPSISYAVDAGSGVLAITRATLDTTTAYLDLRTLVAISSNGGVSWISAGEANTVTPIQVDTSDSSLCDGAATPCTVSGVLVHEVPSIVEDASDSDTSARYKLFNETYLELLPPDGGSANRFQYNVGYIGMATAPSPSGPWTAETNVLGWNGASSLSSSGTLLNVSTLSGLANTWALGEPGAIVGPQGLDLAVTALDLVDGHFDIELFRSTDHGQSWSHVSTMLPGADATSMCGASPAFSGADLFIHRGIEYLTVVTGAPEPGQPNAYNACLVFRVADPAGGTLAMDSSGKPQVLQRIRAADDRFFGPCTYAEGAAAAGYLATEDYVGQIPLIRSYNTGLSPP